MNNTQQLQSLGNYYSGNCSHHLRKHRRQRRLPEFERAMRTPVLAATVVGGGCGGGEATNDVGGRTFLFVLLVQKFHLGKELVNRGLVKSSSFNFGGFFVLFL